MGRTLSAVAAEGAARLTAAGILATEAQQDARVLARAVLAWDAARWLADAHYLAPPPEFEAVFAAAIDRRARREPVAYILGEREFYGRPFLVSKAVLIPRPETELVVDRALAIVAAGRREAALTILDVGTGSGCLAITLALECPAARIVATDISAAALEAAAANAARHGVADRIELRRGSLVAGLQAADLIVTNPPYVADRERASLSPEVRDYEPAGALFGGEDGLGVIRELVPAAFHVLRPGGWLVMEIGAGQWNAVHELARRAGFEQASVHDDLAGIPRVVVARSGSGR
jgi:release factor glutamine methyltransferase